MAFHTLKSQMSYHILVIQLYGIVSTKCPDTIFYHNASLSVLQQTSLLSAPPAHQAHSSPRVFGSVAFSRRKLCSRICMQLTPWYISVLNLNNATSSVRLSHSLITSKQFKLFFQCIYLSLFPHKLKFFSSRSLVCFIYCYIPSSFKKKEKKTITQQIL